MRVSIPLVGEILQLKVVVIAPFSKLTSSPVDCMRIVMGMNLHICSRVSIAIFP